MINLPSNKSSMSILGTGAWLTRLPGTEAFWEVECGLKHFVPAREQHEDSRIAKWFLQSFYEALADSGLATASLEGKKIRLIAGVCCQSVDTGFIKLLTKHLSYLAEVEELTGVDPILLSQDLFKMAARTLAENDHEYVIISLVQDNPASLSDMGAVTLVCGVNTESSRQGKPAERIVGSLELLQPGARAPEAVYFGICADSGNGWRRFLARHARAARLDDRFLKPWIVDVNTPGTSAKRSTHALASVLKSLLALDRGISPITQLPGRIIPGFRTNQSCSPWFGRRDHHRRGLMAFIHKSGAELVMRMSRPTGPVVASFNKSSPHLFCFSEDTPERLLAELRRIQKPAAGALDPGVLSRRLSRDIRLAIIAENSDEVRSMANRMVQHISAAPESFWNLNQKVFYSGRSTDREKPKVAMMFPGQGSQFFSMNQDVLTRFPLYRRWVEAWNAKQCGDEPRPIAESIYPEKDLAAGRWQQTCRQNLGLIEVGGQAALINSFAMFELLRAQGVNPNALVGCSNGENVALAASGTLHRLDEAQILELMSSIKASFLSKASGSLPGGRMLSVTIADRAPLLDLVEKYPDELYLALDNCPTQIVLFAVETSLRSISELIRKLGGMVLPLPFDRPYHTPLFEAASKKLSRLYDEMNFGAFKIPIYSCATAAIFPNDSEGIKNVACSLWHKPVLFRQTVERMYADGVRIFLEVGPGSRLAGFVKDTLRQRPHFSMSASSDTEVAVPRLLGTLGLLFANRVWDPGLLYQDNQASIEEVQSNEETAPVEHRDTADRKHSHFAVMQDSKNESSRIVSLHLSLMSHFLKSQENLALALYDSLRNNNSFSAVAPGPTKPRRPIPPQLPADSRLLSEKRRERNASCWTCNLNVQKHSFLRDHAFGKLNPALDQRLLPLPILPLAYSLELALQAATDDSTRSPTPVEFRNVVAFKWITLEQGNRKLKVQLESSGQGSTETFSCRLRSDDSTDDSLLFKTDLSFKELPVTGDAIAKAPPTSVPWSASDFYDVCLFHGKSFRVIHRVTHCSANRLEGEVSRPTKSYDSPATFLPVDLVDAFGQLGGYWLVAACGLRDFGAFPVAIGSLSYFHVPDFENGVGECRATFQKHGNDITGNVDLIDSKGRLCITCRQFRMRIFPFSTKFMSTLYWQRPELDFSSPIDQVQTQSIVTRCIDLRDHPYLEDGGDLWMNCLAFITLTALERREWLNLTGSHAYNLDWLTGRIAVKDVVREVLRRTRQIARFPSEIEVADSSQGQFSILVPIANSESVEIRVALRQKNGTTVAAADINGRSVGTCLSAWLEDPPTGSSEQPIFPDRELIFLEPEDMIFAQCCKEAVAQATATAPGFDWLVGKEDRTVWTVSNSRGQYRVNFHPMKIGWVAIARTEMER